MAITALGAVATFQANGTRFFVVNLPSGIVNQTLLKMIVTSDNVNTIFDTLAGWTLDRTDQITNGDKQQFWKYSRVSDGTDGTTVTLTANIAEFFGAVVDGFNGCDNTTGSFGAGERDFSFNGTNSATPATSPVTLTGTSITPSAGDMLVYAGGVDCSGNNGTYSTPVGYGAPVQTPSGNQAASIMMSELIASASGATGNVTNTWTQSGNNGNFAIYLMALKQFVAPGPVPGTSNLLLAGQTPGRIVGTVIVPNTAKVADRCREAVRSIFLPRYRPLGAR
jgi:hypothetical protein